MSHLPEASDYEKSLFDIEPQQITQTLAIPGNKAKLDETALSEYISVLLRQESNVNAKKSILHTYDQITRILREPDPLTEDTIIELDIPSGKIVTGDSLFSAVPDLTGYYSINHGEGLDRYSRQLNKETGLGYIFAGNTSPHITKDKNGVIKVVNFELDHHDEEILVNGEQILAWVNTDLWAVSMIDHDKWVAYGGGENGKPNSKSDRKYQVFEVTPGKYRLSIHSHQDDIELNTTERFELATMKLMEPY